MLIYLVFLAALGLPILTAEFAVGRGSMKGPGKSYEILEAKGSKWHSFKWFSIMGNYLLMMFYTMVGGWMLNYVYQVGFGKLDGKDAEGINGVFLQMLDSPGLMALLAGIFAVAFRKPKKI